MFPCFHIWPCMGFFKWWVVIDRMLSLSDVWLVRRRTIFLWRRSILDHDFLHRFLLSWLGRNLLLRLTLFLWYRGNHYPFSFPHSRFHLESREFVRRGKFIFEECTIVHMCESLACKIPIFISWSRVSSDIDMSIRSFVPHQLSRTHLFVDQ